MGNWYSENGLDFIPQEWGIGIPRMVGFHCPRMGNWYSENGWISYAKNGELVFREWMDAILQEWGIRYKNGLWYAPFSTPRVVSVQALDLVFPILHPEQWGFGTSI